MPVSLVFNLLTSAVPPGGGIILLQDSGQVAVDLPVMQTEDGGLQLTGLRIEQGRIVAQARRVD